MKKRNDKEISDFQYGFCPEPHDRRMAKLHTGLAAMKFAHKNEFRFGAGTAVLHRPSREKYLEKDQC